jgi:hypothetical protein
VTKHAERARGGAAEGRGPCHDWKDRCVEMPACLSVCLTYRCGISPPLRQQQYPLLTSCGLWRAFLCRLCFPPPLPADSGTGPSCAATRRARHRLSLAFRHCDVTARSAVALGPSGTDASVGVTALILAPVTTGVPKLHAHLFSGHGFVYPWFQGTTVGTRTAHQSQLNYTLCFLLLMTV